MAIKINYNRVRELSEEMVDSLDNFQTDLNRFRSDVNDYAAVVQDAISQNAIEICEDIERVVKETKLLIKGMSEKVSEGMDQINRIETDLGGKIRNV